MLNRAKSLLLVLVLLYFVSSSYGMQDTNRDSLKLVLTNFLHDSTRINILEQLATTGNYSDRIEAISYFKQILEYKIPDRKRGEILNRIGFFNWQLGNFQQSITYYKQALKVFEELNDSSFVGRIHNNIAASNWGLGNNTEALNNYQTALNYRRAIGDRKGVSTVLNNIGKLYQDLGLYDEAFKMHMEAMELGKEINYIPAIAYSYSNIGTCYENTNKLNSALESYKTGYNIFVKFDSQNRSNSYFSSSIGGVFLKLNQLDSALHYNLNALDYAHRINNKNRIAIAEYKLGINFLGINQIDSAEYYINRSFNKSLQKGYASLLKDNFFAFAKIEEQKGNLTDALKYYKKASVLTDSLYNDNVVSRVADIQTKYLTEQQHQENLLLRKNNEIQHISIRQHKNMSLLLSISTILILIALYFMNRSRVSNKRLNKKLEESERGLKLANANKDKFFTIIAHDLKTPFTGLLGITELLDSDYDKLPPEETKELISLLRQSSTNVYSLLEGLLQWAQTQIGSMEYKGKDFDFYSNTTNVMETCEPVAELKAISIVNKVHPKTIVYADEKSTLTVLRNLVLNAIKFTNVGGTITISVLKKETELEFSVSDNGIGMDDNKIKRLFSIKEKVTQPGTNGEIGTGLGLILCKEFIEKNKGRIWVESEPGKGSIFRFTLPLPKK